MLNKKQLEALADWRKRVWVDERLLTATNFVALLDILEEMDGKLKSLVKPADMTTLKNL